MNLFRRLKCLLGRHDWKIIAVSEKVYTQYRAKQIDMFLQDKHLPSLYKIASGVFNKECIHCSKKSLELDKRIIKLIREN